MAYRGQADVESICIAKRYYAQLAMMKKRFPMEENDPIAVKFAWFKILFFSHEFFFKGWRNEEWT